METIKTKAIDKVKIQTTVTTKIITVTIEVKFSSTSNPKTVERVNLSQESSVFCLKLKSNSTYFKKPTEHYSQEQKLINSLFFRQILPKFLTNFIPNFLSFFNYFPFSTHDDYVLLDTIGSRLSKFVPWP